MTYEPTAWEDEPSTDTPINAANLNKLEEGVESAHDAADSHAADPSGAHAASAIAFTPEGSLVSTNVQDAIAESAEVNTAASAISVSSTTLVGVGTDVQAVLEELDNGIADHLADSAAAHAASAISFTPHGTLASTTVQAAIQEVRDEASALGAAVLSDWTDLGSLGATETITGADDTFVRRKGTVDQACVITLTMADNQQIDLAVEQGGAGAFAVTFVGVDTWVTSSGAAPDTTGRATTYVDRFFFEALDGDVIGYWITEESIPVQMLIDLIGDESTTVTTGIKKVIHSPYAFTLTAVVGEVSTVSSSGAVTVDVSEGASAGTTVLGNKIVIDQSEETTLSAATPPTIADSAIANGGRLSFEVDGAGTGAKGLKVWLFGTRSL